MKCLLPKVSFVLICSFLFFPSSFSTHLDKRSIVDSIENEFTGLLSALYKVTEDASQEVASLEKNILKGAEDLESLLARYRASVFVRLQCETPDSTSAQEANVTATLPIEEERALLTARRDNARSTLSALLGTELSDEELPVIGLCGSGGGIRAQYGTLGWLRAAERLKLLDTVQYVSGLSGSTWAFNPWIASQLSVKDYSAQCVPRLSKTLEEQLRTLTPDDEKDLFITLARSYFDKRFLSFVDLYGWFLGHLFLKGLPHVKESYDFTLSSLTPQIASGAFPFVISTSIIGSTELIRHDYGYSPTVEFSPLFSGSFEAGFFVPIWALGRSFNKGLSQPTFPVSLFPEAVLADDLAEKIAPEATQFVEAIEKLATYIAYHDYYGREFPLAHLMGICGSAFCIDLQNLLLELLTQVCNPSHNTEEWALALSILQEVLAAECGKLIAYLSDGEISQKDATHKLNNEQLSAAIIGNPVFGLIPDQLSSGADISLVDAGLGIVELARCNIGIMPLLHRGVDCIFICDSSADYYQAPSLRAAEMLAKKASLPFPKICYDTINAHEVALIVDEDQPQAPIIVYLPLAANEGYSKKIGRHFNPHASEFNALEFCYSPQQAQDLMGLVEYLLEDSYDLFKEALSKAVDRKKKARVLQNPSV